MLGMCGVPQMDIGRGILIEVGYPIMILYVLYPSIIWEWRGPLLGVKYLKKSVDLVETSKVPDSIHYFF